MKASEITLGDVLVLNSGGPRMTVRAAYNDGMGEPMVRCIWFNDGGELKDDWFMLGTLREAPKVPGPRGNLER